MASVDDAGDPSSLSSRQRAQELYSSMPADPGASGVAADLQRLCRAAVVGLPVAGAVVHIVPGRDTAGVAAASGPRWRVLGELVETLGEAPCLDAAWTLRPVLVADLAAARHRWPAYALALGGHGVAAVFSLPMQVGAVRFGVLDLYVGVPGALRPDDLALALALARVGTAILLTGVRTEGSGLDTDDPRTDRVVELLSDLDGTLNRAEVHQAQGMVMVLLDVGLTEALLLLRARAFASGRPLAELARDVVSGVVDPRSWGDD
jgi:hypothetical protein